VNVLLNTTSYIRNSVAWRKGLKDSHSIEKKEKKKERRNGETVCSRPLDFRMTLTSHGQLDKLSCVYKWLSRDETPTGKCYVFNTICALLSHLATCALKAS